MTTRVQTLLSLNQNGTTTFSITVPRRLKEKIDAICTRAGIARNQLVCGALEDVVEEAEKKDAESTQSF